MKIRKYWTCLRQGDPLSSYLFGLVMNIHFQKLNDAAINGILSYHPKCKDSGLTHLCFADDLLIFSDGSASSVHVILSFLHEFKLLSSLIISADKSRFFSCGLSNCQNDTSHAFSGIPKGYLSIRYLGLPLCTKKLSILNCEPLLQSIKNKISTWTIKYLSFADRQVLINIVIAGITNFWCSAFILPMEYITEINSMCSAYLWKGTLEGRHTARVAWETLTTPKEEGGLGLKNLELWNRTCSVKLLWLLIFRTESIWVAWIHHNVIKETNIWDIKEKQSHTWVFKKLLRLRDTSMQWIRIVHGNGKNCRL